MTENAGFEHTLAELAYSSIMEKDASLMDHLIGFQLIDKNDEGTRALGFFAMRLGQDYYYVPVFFLGGRLKPIELAYSRKQDMFFPLTTQWVQYLAKDSLREFGESIERPKHRFSNPDLRPFREPPTTGRLVTASDNNLYPDWYDITKMSEVLYPRKTSNLDTILKVANENIKDKVRGIFKDNKELLKLACELLPWNRLKEALDTTLVSDLEKKASQLFNKKAYEDVHILEKQSSSAEILAKADDATKKALAEFGISAIDNRPRSSQVYKVQKSRTYESVSAPGVYKVIDTTGKTRTVYASNIYISLTRPSSDAPYIYTGKTNVRPDPIHSLIIDLNSGGALRVPSTQLLGEKHKDESVIAQRMLTGARHHTSVETGRHYVMVLKRGSELIASEPFKVSRKTQDEAGMFRFSINPLWRIGESIDTIVVNPKGGSSISVLDTVATTTSDVRFFPIHIAASSSDPLRLGNRNSTTTQILDDNLNQVTVTSDGTEAAIRTHYKQLDNLSKKACASIIAKDLGIRGEQAVELTKQAFETGEVTTLVKIAMPYAAMSRLIPRQYGTMPYAEDPETYRDPTLDADITSSRQEEHPQTMAGGPGMTGEGKFTAEVGDNTIDNMIAPQGMSHVGQHDGPGGQGLPPISNIEDDRQLAMMAAQSGVPEVFDAGILSTMASMEEAHEMVLSYMPELERAVDRLGRMIFMLYWKYSNFSDQYGINELYETEDKLRNLFKSLGDLVIKFKRKSTSAAAVVPHGE